MNTIQDFPFQAKSEQQQQNEEKTEQKTATPTTNKKGKDKEKQKVLTKVYSFPVSSMSAAEWKQHKKRTTLQKKESSYLKRKGWKQRKKNEFNLWGETEEFYCVPPQYGVDEFGAPDEDLRPHGVPIDVEMKTKLWGADPDDPFNQIEVADAIQKHFLEQKRGGAIELPTSSGKTILLLYIVTQLLKLKALVIAPFVALHNQLLRRIKKYAPAARVGVIHQQTWDVDDKDIVVAMLHTLAGQEYEPNAFKEFGVVIFDEVDKVATKHFSRVLYKLADIRYIIGLSATVERNDGMESLFPLFLGPYIFRAPMATRDSRNTCVQALVYEEGANNTIYQRTDPTAPNVDLMIKRLLADENRHAKILDVLDALYAQKRRVVVLAQGVKYGARLTEDSQARHPERPMVHYKRTLKEEDREFIDDHPHDLVVATYSIFSVGMDLGYLDTLLMITPRKTIKQAIGRLRSYTEYTRQPLLILDLVDMCGFFIGQHAARRRIYRKRQYRHLADIELKTPLNLDHLGPQEEEAEQKKNTITNFFKTTTKQKPIKIDIQLEDNKNTNDPFFAIDLEEEEQD